MASLGEIRAGIRSVVKASVSGMSVYADVPDVAQVPALVVMPAKETADFNGAMGRGLDTYKFDLYVLVARGESTAAQQALDQYVSGSGPRSLRQIFFEHGDLGLSDGTDAHAEGARDYGGKFSTARIDHVGAIVQLTVRTTST